MFDIQQILDDIRMFIDTEMLIDVLVKQKGWHCAIVRELNICEIENWLVENIHHKYVGYGTIWAFEDKNDYMAFILRFRICWNTKK